MCFYGQKANKQDALEDLTSKLRDHFASSPPTAGAYKRKYLINNRTQWLISASSNISRELLVLIEKFILYLGYYTVHKKREGNHPFSLT